VHFTVTTDSKSQPIQLLTLSATIVAETELRPKQATETIIPTGQAASQSFTIATRRSHPGDQGRGAPDAIVAVPPVMASFAGPCRESQRLDGWIETERDFVVQLPPSDSEGLRSGEFLLKWSTGEELRHVIAWKVTPHIRVSPSGIVIRAGDGPIHQEIELRSEDRPFHILGVEGPLLDPSTPSAPTAADKRHRFIVTLDPRRAPRDGAIDLGIATDHPDQRSLTLTVVVLGGGK
jgi:hypothetical protein